MSKQLDILALEPFYGGARRAMLETVVRCSRHRWTVLRLPPRRIERRLSAAANWFSEQLGRHWVGRVDLLFTSEAMNLASLLRLSPQLARYPSVVYFHDNQLPNLAVQGDGPLDLVNLNTAAAASEIWFNSEYHRRLFVGRAGELVVRHAELSAHNPIPAIQQKARVMPPPVDLDIVGYVQKQNTAPTRNPRAIFFETRGANIGLLNDALAQLRGRAVPFTTITVGPVDDLDPNIPRYTIAENEDANQVRGMFEAGVFLSTKTEAPCDYQALRALLAGCRPVLPDAGVYPEIVPAPMHKAALYQPRLEPLTDRLLAALNPSTPPFHYDGFRQAFRPFDAIPACRAFDERIDQLVAQGKD